jgi:hypothetical protein
MLLLRTTRKRRQSINRGKTMESKRQILTKFIITVALGTVFCLIVGLCFFGLKVFVFNIPASQFLIVGLTGSIFYSLLKFRSVRDAILIMILLYLANILAFGSDRFLLTRLLFFVGISGALFVFFRYFDDRIKELKFGKFLTVASLFTIMYVVCTIVLQAIYNSADFKTELLYNLDLGFLIGLGLGLGIEISNGINSRLEPEV